MDPFVEDRQPDNHAGGEAKEAACLVEVIFISSPWVCTLLFLREMPPPPSMEHTWRYCFGNAMSASFCCQETFAKFWYPSSSCTHGVFFLHTYSTPYSSLIRHWVYVLLRYSRCYSRQPPRSCTLHILPACVVSSSYSVPLLISSVVLVCGIQACGQS